MKHVTVRLNGGLERYAGGRRELLLPVDDGATAASIQGTLGIPKGEVGFFVVDRQICDEDHPVAGASVVEIYPVFGGG